MIDNDSEQKAQEENFCQGKPINRNTKNQQLIEEQIRKYI